MILELAFPYVSVVIVAVFWLLAMRPVLRLIHASAPGGARARSGVGRRDRVARRRGPV